MLSVDSQKTELQLADKKRSGIPGPNLRNVNNNIDKKIARTPSLKTDRIVERRDDIRRSSFLLRKQSDNGCEGLTSPRLFGRKNILEGLRSGLQRSKSKDETSMRDKAESSLGKRLSEDLSFKVLFLCFIFN